MSYDGHRWWSRVAQIRNAMDQRHNFHEAQALAMEQATAELIDDACSPWFDGRSFLVRADSGGKA